MPSNEGDIKLTFDNTAFKTAVKEIVGGMGKIQETTKNMSEKVTKGMGGTLDKFAIKWAAIKGIVRGVFTSMQTYIPEIGQTFKLSGNIILKNLLWPIRKELLPVMQKLLNWTRDNRLLFVQFGVVLVNVFKTVKAIFSSIFVAIDPIIKMIKNAVKSIFGDTAQTIMETINLALLKITAFAILVGDMVKPLFEGISSAISGVIEAIARFTEGFTSGFKKTFGNDTFINWMTDYRDLFNEIGIVLGKASFIFKDFGAILGTTVAVALQTVIGLARTLANTLEFLFKIIADKSKIKEAWDVFKSKEVGIGAGLGQSAVRGAGVVKDVFTKSAKVEPVQDVIVTKEGRVLKTSPEDTIMAMKKNTTAKIGGSSGKIDVNFNFGDFKVYTTEGNAQNAGMGVAKGLERQIRNILLETLNTEGAY